METAWVILLEKNSTIVICINHKLHYVISLYIPVKGILDIKKMYY